MLFFVIKFGDIPMIYSHKISAKSANLPLQIITEFKSLNI